MALNIISIPKNNEVRLTTNGFVGILSDLRGVPMRLVLCDHQGVEVELVGINRGDRLAALSGGTYLYSRYDVVDIL